MNREKSEKIILAFAVIIFMTGIYTGLQKYIDEDNSALIATSIDPMIPFIPAFVIFYTSYYLIMVLPFFIIENIKDYRKAAIGYIFITIVSAAFFIFLPARILRPDVTGGMFFGNALSLIYSLDNPVNTFPSMHVSITTFAALLTFRYKRHFAKHVALVGIMIALSTLFIKQHYVLDVIGGIALGFIAYILVFIIPEKIKQNNPEKY